MFGYRRLSPQHRCLSPFHSSVSSTPSSNVREVFPHTALRGPSPGGIQLVYTIRPCVECRPAFLQ
jgi:hypothetical protein